MADSNSQSVPYFDSIFPWNPHSSPSKILFLNFLLESMILFKSKEYFFYLCYQEDMSDLATFERGGRRRRNDKFVFGGRFGERDSFPRRNISPRSSHFNKKGESFSRGNSHFNKKGESPSRGKSFSRGNSHFNKKWESPLRGKSFSKGKSSPLPISNDSSFKFGEKNSKGFWATKKFPFKGMREFSTYLRFQKVNKYLKDHNFIFMGNFFIFLTPLIGVRAYTVRGVEKMHSQDDKKGEILQFEDGGNTVIEGERDEILFQENKGKICCYQDLVSLFPRNFTLVNKYSDIILEPKFNTLLLNKVHLITLERDKFSLLLNFQIEISSLLTNIYYPQRKKIEEMCGRKEVEYAREIFDVLAYENGEHSSMRTIVCISPFNHRYVSKRKLPLDFGKKIYFECLRYSAPEILLLIINFYIGRGDSHSYIFGDSYAPCNWDQLLGEARREYLNWELGEILIYKEQAIFLAESLISEEEEEEEEDDEGLELAIYERWVRKLAKQLKKNAHILPPDPHQPSIFPNRKYNPKKISKKDISRVCCEADIISLVEEREERAQFMEELKTPIFHNIYLRGLPLLTIKSTKSTLLSNFQTKIGVALNVNGNTRKEVEKVSGKKEYDYMREVYNLPPASEKEMVDYKGHPPIRKIIKISPWGNKYVGKRPLPYNFAQRVYEECMRHHSPYILLSVFNYYMGDGDIHSHLLGDENVKPDWTYLLVEARGEYLHHDLREIVQYKEQGIFLAESLISEEEEEEEEDDEGLEIPIYERWVRNLAKEIKKDSYVLPPDPHQPSIFPNREKIKILIPI